MMMMRKTGTATVAAMLFGGLLLATPAFAQVDLAGHWASRMHEDWGDRYHGPDAADFLGLPLSEDGLARALSYSSSQLAMPERMCMQYQPDYVVLGPQELQFWSEAEPIAGRVIAWHISGAGDREPLTIWMDGRPHPSENALHTYDGFSTGEWEGNTLIVYTTHMKAGPIRRNGVPTSDQTTLMWRMTLHDALLTITAFISDPVNLSESHVISRTWVSEPLLVERSRYGGPCNPAVELARFNATGAVPHYLPGQNPYANEVSKRYNVPLDAVQGKAETRYPEYRKKMKDAYVIPGRCVRYCCGWMPTAGEAGNNDAPGLNCIAPKAP